MRTQKGKTPQSSDCPVTLLKCNKSCQDILKLKKQITKKIMKYLIKFWKLLKRQKQILVFTTTCKSREKCLVTDNGY